jgi:UDP-glucose 4-epimerase
MTRSLPSIPSESADLTVAVTGATGEIGRPLIRRLESTPGVGVIRAMARRPFVGSDHGWTRTEVIQGDVTNADDIAKFVDGADVVVHLAFLILGDRRSTRATNLVGSRQVFQAAVSAGCRRVVYASSVAAYGFHAERPDPLTEDTAPVGTEHFYYSAQKAELEAALAAAVDGTTTDAYVFRPPFVGGPGAHAWLQILPYVQMSTRLPLSWLVDRLPRSALVLPDFGVRMQIVHVEDVSAALCAGVIGAGPAGVYNIAAPGTLTMTHFAYALGWHPIQVPYAAIDLAARVQRRLPVKPALSEWVQALSVPVIMSTEKAERELPWQATRDARTTLDEAVASARGAGMPGLG